MNKKSFIGVDAGGTKIDVLIECESKQYSAQFNGINARNESEKALGLRLSDAIRDTAPGGLNWKEVSLCIGAAGAGTKTVQNALWQHISAYLNVRNSSVNVVSDARIAHAAAFGVTPKQGTTQILIICGTGSGCYTVSNKGELVRCGGWGPMLGDPASGSAIGTAGIRYLLAALESDESSEFADAIFEAIKAQTAKKVSPGIPAVLDAVYANSFKAALIAETILRFSEKDSFAKAILISECSLLADQCARLCRSVISADQGPVQISLTGGLTNDQVFLDHMSQAIKKDVPDAIVERSGNPPVSGALALSRMQA